MAGGTVPVLQSGIFLGEALQRAGRGLPGGERGRKWTSSISETGTALRTEEPLAAVTQIAGGSGGRKGRSGLTHIPVAGLNLAPPRRTRPA